MSEINWNLVATALRHEGASGVVSELESQGYAIVPKYPTYEQVMKGLHPAIPGSVTEIYHEMIKAAPKVA
jgi:hypothetical protein